MFVAWSGRSLECFGVCMPNPSSDRELLSRIATRVGTPFWGARRRGTSPPHRRREEAHRLRRRAGALRHEGESLASRAEGNAGPGPLDRRRERERMRPRAQGRLPRREQAAKILYTADVFRDGWRDAILKENLLPNLGSPGMIADLTEACYRGPIALRVTSASATAT